MLSRIRQMMTNGSGDPERDSPGPAVSIVVVVYDMAKQAENTLNSLSPDYQQGVSTADYEVIVVENASPRPMQPEFVASLPDNFRYFLRQESEPTPVHAINFGARESRGRHVCIMIDGARLVTPGVVKNILRAHRLMDQAVVTVPGYHIGFELQQDAIDHGYGVAEDRALLQSIDWPADGYRLFDIACFSGSSAPGFFQPNSESNCISMARQVWEELGGLDLRFNLRGGGMTNLDLYKRACEHPGNSARHPPGGGDLPPVSRRRDHRGRSPGSPGCVYGGDQGPVSGDSRTRVPESGDRPGFFRGTATAGTQVRPRLGGQGHRPRRRSITCLRPRSAR